MKRLIIAAFFVLVVVLVNIGAAYAKATPIIEAGEVLGHYCAATKEPGVVYVGFYDQWTISDASGKSKDNIICIKCNCITDNEGKTICRPERVTCPD